MENSSGYVCTNASCQRTFTRPLKTIIVGVSTEPFNACPYCLTEIACDVTLAPSSLPPSEGPSKPPKATVEKQPQATASPSPANCSRHLGYLSERGAKEPIPDDCLTCTEIVRCMLKQAKDKSVDS